MQAIGSYDGSLQMFTQAPRDPSIPHLLFLRWLGEQNLLEHPICKPASGSLSKNSNQPCETSQNDPSTA